MPIERPVTSVGSMLSVVLVAAILLLWFAPSERTLGTGIKVVYLHVASTWAGQLGIMLAGMLGGPLLF